MKKYRYNLLKQSIIIFITLIFFALSVSSASYNISSCATLNESNAIYYLNQSILDSTIEYCINITADNITLDCQGHTIDAAYSGGYPDYGIYIYRTSGTNSNITIKNCILSDWKKANIYIRGGDNNTIQNVNSSKSQQGHGIHIQNSDSNTLVDITASQNKGRTERFSGIYLYASDLNTLVNITANGNEYYGIYMIGSDSNNLSNINASSNTRDGIQIHNSNLTILSNIISNSNGLYYSGNGILISDSEGTVLKDSKFINNGAFDVNLESSVSSDCSLSFINVTGTDNKPIVFYNSSVNLNNWNNNASEIILCGADNSIIDNLTINHIDTVNNGLLIVNTDNSNFTNLNLIGFRYGLSLYKSHSNIILGANIDGTDEKGNGIELFESNSNNISYINTTQNNNGIYLWGLNIGSYSNTLSNINSYSDRTYGIYLKKSDLNTIFQSTMNSNMNGIGLSDSNLNNISNITADSNNYDGIEIESSYSNILSNISLIENQYGIYFMYSDSNFMSNIAASSNDYGIHFYYSNNNTLEDSKLLNNTKFDVNYYTTRSKFDCSCTLKNITGTDDKPIVFYNSSVNLNNWNNNASEIILCGADHTIIDNLTLDHTDEKNNALLITATQNASITNSDFSNLEYGIYLDYSDSNFISNITSNLHDMSGLQMGYSDSNRFTNILSNSNGGGFWFVGSNSNNFSHMTINNNTVTGIYFSSSNSNIFSNITANFNEGPGYSDGRGIYASGSNNNFSDMILNSNKNNGVTISGSSNYISNIIANLNGKGISVGGSYNIISNITAMNSSSSGISISNSYSVISDIISSQNGQDGIYISGSYNNLSNVISNSNKIGIDCDNSQHNKLSNITIKNNNDYGIRMTRNSDYNSIIGCRIENNNKAGINLSSYYSSRPEFNIFYNNIFNNSLNFLIDSSITNPNYWNTTNHTATNIINGTIIGGNAWATPAGTGYSQTCMDSDEDGICDEQYNLTVDGLNFDYFPLAFPVPPVPLVCINYANETVNVSYRECYNDSSNNLRECVGNYLWALIDCYKECGYYKSVHQCLNASCVLCPTNCTADEDCINESECINNQCRVPSQTDRPPELIKDIPDIMINESQTLYNLFDIDHYFYDLKGYSLAYNFSGNNHTTITIDEFNRVTITAQSGWYGKDYVIFNAIDPDDRITESNNVTITILPKEGFLYDIGSLDYYPWTDIYAQSSSCYIVDKYGNRQKCKIQIKVWQ
ncbi:MAG: NosD domain-containing protein [Nanoarchaeota archaeon]|nr:NosD domain-containing protein [Nanoarchaeota archaeon]